MEDGDFVADIDIIDIIPLIAIVVAEDPPKHSNTSIASEEGVLPGADFLQELLNCGNNKRIYRVLQMKKETFKKLCLWFRKRKLLYNSRNIAIEQQVAQFL
jgi:hypothetical protein